MTVPYNYGADDKDASLHINTFCFHILDRLLFVWLCAVHGLNLTFFTKNSNFSNLVIFKLINRVHRLHFIYLFMQNTAKCINPY